MGTKQPAVSIGLPVYNGERFIRNSLESIARQTFEDFELIISDNASTDATADICQSYASVDSRIRYARNQVNIGAAANFNKVFEMATAPLFRWATADDVFSLDSLECCVRVLEQHPEAVLCYPRTILIDGSGQPIRAHYENLDVRVGDPVERFRLVASRLRMVNVHYGLVRSAALSRSGLMGNYPGGDIPLILELSLHGQFHEVPETCFYRRMHGGALSSVTTMEGDQEFWDPKTKGRLFFRNWKHYGEYLRSVGRAPLTSTERVRLAYVIVRQAVASRSVLLRELARGFGGNI